MSEVRINSPAHPPKKQSGNFLLESLIAIALVSLAITSYANFSLKTTKHLNTTHQEYVMTKQIQILSERLYRAKNVSPIYRQWQQETAQLLPTIETHLNGSTLQFRFNPEDPFHEIAV